MADDISFNRLLNLGRAWLAAGGQETVELAAMEPTLWRDGKKTISDVIAAFADLGFLVNLTTNGSTLARQAPSLAKVPINKLRISWHSLNPNIYEKITGGSYEIFFRGIQLCQEFNLPLCYNRILLKNHVDDIQAHIDMVDKQGSRIKFLELYITQANRPFFNKYHMGLEDFTSLLNSFGWKDSPDRMRPAHAARERYAWLTPNNGRVEFKIAETCEKSHVCASCNYKRQCIEGFAEYIRIIPNGKAAFCYLREEFDVRIFNGDSVDFTGVRQFLKTANIDFDKFARQRSLRLILTPKCNYNCGFPDGEASFCLGKRFGERMLRC